MNLQQLKIVREAVRRNFNLTEVADALSTSQSGVSKHIKDLEQELGVELFVRKGKRLLDLTDPGREIIGAVQRILNDAGNIRRVADQLARSDAGQLVIATTHTQARYALPPVVATFRKRFPEVRLVFLQTNPSEIVAMLREDRADIGIATETVASHSDLVTFPYYTWRHAIIVPKGHALEGQERLTLRDLSKHPIITYHEGFAGRPAITRAFERLGLKPDIVMEAIDSDVIKAYVELGMGIGIVAAMALDPSRDQGFSALKTPLFFEENTTYIAVHRRRYLRGFAFAFIEMCRPGLVEADIRAAQAAGLADV